MRGLKVLAACLIIAVNAPPSSTTHQGSGNGGAGVAGEVGANAELQAGLSGPGGLSAQGTANVGANLKATGQGSNGVLNAERTANIGAGISSNGQGAGGPYSGSNGAGYANVGGGVGANGQGSSNTGSSGAGNGGAGGNGGSSGQGSANSGMNAGGSPNGGGSMGQGGAPNAGGRTNTGGGGSTYGQGSTSPGINSGGSANVGGGVSANGQGAAGGLNAGGSANIGTGGGGRGQGGSGTVNSGGGTGGYGPGTGVNAGGSANVGGGVSGYGQGSTGTSVNAGGSANNGGGMGKGGSNGGMNSGGSGNGNGGSATGQGSTGSNGMGSGNVGGGGGGTGQGGMNGGGSPSGGGTGSSGQGSGNTGGYPDQSCGGSANVPNYGGQGGPYNQMPGGGGFNAGVGLQVGFGAGGPGRGGRHNRRRGYGMRSPGGEMANIVENTADLPLRVAGNAIDTVLRAGTGLTEQAALDIENLFRLSNFPCSIMDAFNTLITVALAAGGIISSFLPGTGILLAQLFIGVLKILVCVEGPGFSAQVRIGFNSPDEAAFCRPNYCSRWNIRDYSGNYNSVSAVYNYYGLGNIQGQFEAALNTYTNGRGLKGLQGPERLIAEWILELSGIVKAHPNGDFSLCDMNNMITLLVKIMGGIGNSYGSGVGDLIAEKLILYIAGSTHGNAHIFIDLKSELPSIKAAIDQCDRSSIGVY